MVGRKIEGNAINRQSKVGFSPLKSKDSAGRKAVRTCWYCGKKLKVIGKGCFCMPEHEVLWDRITDKALKRCDKIKNCEVCGKKLTNDVGDSHSFNLSFPKANSGELHPKVDSHRYCSEACFQKGFAGKKGIGMVIARK